MDYEKFSRLFFPKTIAVIGASNNPVGAVKYVKAHKNKGIDVFPVNVNPDLVTLEDLPVYRSIKDIVPDIDLAIIGVPKQYVPSVIDEFKEKTVYFAVIFTSGFKESGNSQLDRELEKSIEGVDTRFIGPNCLGVYNPRAKLMYFPGMPDGMEYGGNVSIIAQSGGHTAKTVSFLMSRGVYIAKAISIGNAIDLAPLDFLNYFKEDPDTKVVGFYLESTKNGRSLMKNLEKITKNKPVVIWKGGQGNTGFKATASHTGELAGDIKIWKAMCKQTGTIFAENFDIFCDLVTMFSFNLPIPKSLKIGLIACGGGNAVEAADIFEAGGFEIPELLPSTKKKIGEFIPDVNSSFSNPVDLGEYGYVPKYFAKAIDIISQDENIDGIVYIKESSRFPLFSVNFLMSADKYETVTVDELRDITRKNKKRRNIPLYLNDPFISEALDGFTCRVSFRDKLNKVGIPVFGRIDVLMQSIKKAHEYGIYLKNKKEINS